MAGLTDLLKAVNARRDAGSAKLEGEEAEKALEALRERDFARQLAEQAAKETGTEPEPPKDLRRSTLSALGKSEYIEKFTKAAYDKLPW